MKLIENIESSIYNWYPIHTMPDEHYYNSHKYFSLQKMIESKHLNRSLVKIIMMELQTTFISLKVEDILMGRDFPSYIIQMTSYQDSVTVRAVVLYISFIYPAHSCLCLEMNYPLWVVEETKPNLYEIRIIQKASEISKKYFNSSELSNSIYEKKLENIWLRSEFKIFNGLYSTAPKII